MIGRRNTERLFLRGNVTLAPTAQIDSTPVGSHCITVSNGLITIGARTRIGCGAALSSQASVTIGADVSIGTSVVIQDSDFHAVDDISDQVRPRPIFIADRVVIGHSVTILPGAVLGAGSHVQSGSVVGGEVRPGEIVAGNPARSRADVSDGHDLGAGQLLARVLSLSTPLDSADVIANLEGFDSLMMLRLLLEIEEIHGLWLDEQQVAKARTVGELETLVLSLTRA